MNRLGVYDNDNIMYDIVIAFQAQGFIDMSNKSERKNSVICVGETEIKTV